MFRRRPGGVREPGRGEDGYGGASVPGGLRLAHGPRELVFELSGEDDDDDDDDDDERTAIATSRSIRV